MNQTTLIALYVLIEEKIMKNWQKQHMTDSAGRIVSYIVSIQRACKNIRKTLLNLFNTSY